MKIGILTHFHKSTNYGGVLQAYALCKYLNDHGHSAEQILYHQRVTKLEDTPMTVKVFFEKVASRIKGKIYRKQNSAIQKRMEYVFSKFRDIVPHTSAEYTKDTIADAEKEFEAFITGSDQVWNPIWHDSSYMLDFVGDDIPKISYAASIGVGSLSAAQQRIFAKHLSRFQSLSVREKEGADALKPVLTQNAKVCVDPTLLLSAEEWNEIVTARKIEENYVFLYMLGDDKEARKTAKEFAAKKGLMLVLIPDLLGKYRAADKKLKGTAVLDATPGDFLSLIKHAEYIFTDSFHACVFSLLFQKEFFVFDRVGGKKTDSRIRNLTEMFECAERFRINKDERTVDALLSVCMMDYSKDCELFIKAKQKSVAFLENSLNFG